MHMESSLPYIDLHLHLQNSVVMRQCKEVTYKVHVKKVIMDITSKCLTQHNV